MRRYDYPHFFQLRKQIQKVTLLTPSKCWSWYLKGGGPHVFNWQERMWQKTKNGNHFKKPRVTNRIKINAMKLS